MGSEILGLDKIGKISGVKVFTDSGLSIREQFRFPRSKRKRIKKKWRKQRGNWRNNPDPNVYCVGRDVMVMHPAVAHKIEDKLDNQ